MSNMPSSFTTFCDSLSWAMLRFDVPGTGTPTADDDGADDGGRRLEDQSPDGAGNASNPSNATTSGMPYESKVKRNNLAGTVFWNGFGLIFFVVGHYWYESIMFKKGAAVPDMFAFPSLEIKLVTLSMPGLLSTSMLVMADKDQSIGYRALGTFVVLWCIAFILLCGRVLHHMEKYKPVRFTYAENFPVGNGEMATYRNAPLRWKAWSLITFKSISVGEWGANEEMFKELESAGWDEHPMPKWVTFRFFGEEPLTTTERCAQFHRNWSPLYSHFRGGNGKINYVFEMSAVFFMCVFLAGATGATQAALIWVLNNLTVVYNAVFSPYGDNFASNSNELIMKVGKWVTMLLPLAAYGNSISFETVGTMMMNIQLAGLGANCIFQMYKPIKGIVECALAAWGAGKEVTGAKSAKWEMKGMEVKVPLAIPGLGKDLQEILSSVVEIVTAYAQSSAQEATTTYTSALQNAMIAWQDQHQFGDVPSKEDRGHFMEAAVVAVEKALNPPEDDDGEKNEEGEENEGGGEEGHVEGDEEQGNAGAAESKDAEKEPAPDDEEDVTMVARIGTAYRKGLTKYVKNEVPEDIKQMIEEKAAALAESSSIGVWINKMVGKVQEVADELAEVALKKIGENLFGESGDDFQNQMEQGEEIGEEIGILDEGDEDEEGGDGEEEGDGEVRNPLTRQVSLARQASKQASLKRMYSSRGRRMNPSHDIDSLNDEGSESVEMANISSSSAAGTPRSETPGTKEWVACHTPPRKLVGKYVFVEKYGQGLITAFHKVSLKDAVQGRNSMVRPRFLSFRSFNSPFIRISHSLQK